MNFVNFLCRRLVLLSVVVFGVVACTSGPAPVGGGNTVGGNTISTLSGTAATGAAIAGTQITIKGANGQTVTADTTSTGTYTANIATLTAPYLLRVSDPLNANSYLFSVATAAGTANIHPFTDLIVRNWYMVKNSTVEAQFTGTLDSTILPTVDGINTIEAVIRSVLATSFANANVQPDFNLITSPFVVNSPGVNSPFDLVLDQTRVVIDPTNGASAAVTIQAVDTNTGTTSTLSNTTLSTNLAIAPALDNTNPTDPGIPVLAATNNSILVKWAASTDAVGVVRYNIYKNGVVFDTSPFPAYLDEGLAPSTSYCYQIKAADAAGLLSAIVPATASCITTRADPDITAPAAPTGLAATASVSQGQIDLTWVASIDQDTVGYDIYRDTVSGTVKVATTAGTSYNNTGLAANTLHSYTVKARDAAGNPSGASNSASATTAAGTPSFPKGVDAVAGNAQVTISWSPVSGATSYNVYTGTVSGFSKISVTPVSVASSPSVQTPLNNGTTYFFVITAVNDLGESISSAQVQATPTSGTILADIRAQIASFNGLFAISRPAATDTRLVAIFAPNYLDDGQNKAVFLTDITDPVFGAPVGFTLIAQALVAPPRDSGAVANDTTHQWFTLACPVCGGSIFNWLAIKDVPSGKWQVAGNQRKVGVSADVSANRSTFNGNVNMNSFASFDLNQAVTAADLITIGVSSVTVSGPGLVNTTGNVGPATLFDGTQTFFIRECSIPSLVTTNCYNYANLAAGDYTFTVNGSLNAVPFTDTYVETLPGIPPATANLTAAMFPVITNVPPLASLVPGATVTANWTLPGGYTPKSSFVSASSTLDFLFDVEGIPGVTGSSFTLPAVFASTGTATSSFLCVTAAATNGALFETCSEGAVTPPPTPISGLVGTWVPPLGVDTSFMLTFFANGDYMFPQSAVNSPGTQPGLEHGTYTWDSATGAFAAACPTVDTNLEAGFSAATGVPCTTGTIALSTTVTVNGDTMTLVDPTGPPLILSRLVVDPNNAIVGSWAPLGDTSLELTFFANGDYMQAQSVGNIPSIDEPGLEHGTYTWNSATGALTAACPTVDTNFQAGFSSGTGAQCTPGSTALSTTVTVSGNTMTLIDNSVSPPASITLSRVN